MNLLVYGIFLLFVRLIGITPFFILYRCSWFLYLLLYQVIGYRKKVVRANLKKVFPHKTEAEIQQLSRNFYRYFTDMLLESVKGYHMSDQELIRRHKLVNPEILAPYYQEGKSILGLTTHFGNFEWGTMSGGLQFSHQAVGFYKPLKNPYIDHYIKKARSRFNTHHTSIFLTHRTFLTYKNQPCIYLMISDQNPSNKEKCIWVQFLGIETAFLHGAEVYAHKLNYPVFYIEINRKKRGYYEIVFKLISENPQSLPPGVLTQMYANAVEKSILDQPAYWLWSHKRWKYQRINTGKPDLLSPH